MNIIRNLLLIICSALILLIVAAYINSERAARDLDASLADQCAPYAEGWHYEPNACRAYKEGGVNQAAEYIRTWGVN